MPLRIDDVHDEGDHLLCPNCESSNLHHYNVEVFERSHEDSPTGLHVTVNETLTCSVSTKVEREDGNPSIRRGGITVHFRCEDCPALSLLTIAQHKGITLVDFEVVASTEGMEMDSSARKYRIHYCAGILRDPFSTEEDYSRFCTWAAGVLESEFPDHDIAVLDDLVITRVHFFPGQDYPQQWATDDDANHEQIYAYCEGLLPRWRELERTDR